MATEQEGGKVQVLQAIAARAPLGMMSSAFYSKIDASHPACFSPTVITGMLRGALDSRGW